jgi:hypothetical protein
LRNTPIRKLFFTSFENIVHIASKHATYPTTFAYMSAAAPNEEPEDNPEHRPSEIPSDNIPPTKNAATTTHNQDLEPMEVHHHAHDPAAPHHKKNWKSYFWEFLMLFLAVFCGFLAEYQLEHTIEHNREKEFIKSMIEDARIDTANIQLVLKQHQKQLKYIDSLSDACYSYVPGKSSDYKIYWYYRYVLSSTEAMKPTERTLTQLKNAGGMRLIRKKKAADLIIFYDSKGKDVETQRRSLDEVSMDAVEASYELFNYKFYKSAGYNDIATNSALLNTDTQKIIQFANRITTFGAGTTVYCMQLEQMKEQAIQLIEVLQQEYQLDK